MELLIFFGIGLSTGLSGAMIPGPLFLYTVSEAFREGQAAGLKIAVGHLVLEGAFVVVVIGGMREWLLRPVFQGVVAWVGAVGLVGMGAMILARVQRLSLTREAHVEFRGGPWLGGAFFSIVSPGFLIWWATIGASVFLESALAGLAAVAAVATGHAVADVTWYWFVAFSVERGRPYCADRTYRLLMAGIALCLMGLGIGLPLKHQFLSLG